MMLFLTEQEIADIALILNRAIEEWGLVGDEEEERLGDSVEFILTKIKDYQIQMRSQEMRNR